MPASVASRLSGQTSVTFASSTSIAADEQTKTQTFALISRGILLFTIFGISTGIFIICGIVRSSIILADTYNKYAQLQEGQTTLNTFQAMEDLAAAVYLESFARMKYMSSGLDPVHYTEMSQAVTDIDTVFNQQAALFQQIYFNIPEYRHYGCSFYRIRSNLAQRVEAVPVNQHRSLDERTVNPWDDIDFYKCLVIQMADIQLQISATASGFEYIWQAVFAYVLTWRSKLNFQVAMNYAYLTRQLILKKGSVAYARKSDSENMDTFLTISELLLQKASEIGFAGTAPSCTPASQVLANLLEEITTITNASQALLFVEDNDKYEPSSRVKTFFTYIEAAANEYKIAMLRLQAEMLSGTYASMASEAVKLFFFIIILPTMAIRSIVHFHKESGRLQGRYEKSLERYIDSCKAIFRLLPEPVAKKLNLGQQVLPEFFHNATVFYSDIVGFTNICSKLTAIEVLRMLNTIYTTFDYRMKLYKCYKIETIGDAYVVASGVPTRTSTHAAEIASLALVLVEEVGMIKLPNSNQKITVRIGINSGPVIAGIVGVKMLRYCLFGKTVLYAHRMEQTSQAQKIQLSHTSYAELLKQGGFIMEERPKSEWPNNEQPTYWLIGRTTTSPTLSLFGAVTKETGLAYVDITA